jgi:hypothetical protein
MARIDPRISTRFGQQSNPSNVKFVLASLPLAILILWFVVEAYRRPEKPYYNLPSYITDDYAIRSAAEESGSFVPLMDMCYVVLSFCAAWACLACYFLGYLRAREAMIDRYLEHGKSILGNIVYEQRCWAFEFRYYGYCSYQHPDPSEDPGTTIADNNNSGQPIVLRKKTRIFEPYTRELVPILILPGYPRSGQGKDDLEFANYAVLQSRPRELFLGRFCVLWTIVCASVPVYILRQMRIIDEREQSAGISEDYDNADKGWIIYGLFLGVGVLGIAAGGNVLAWLYTRWWLLHQATSSRGDLSMHGFDGRIKATPNGDDYRRI